MKAEVITIGDEILIGQTVDTNSAWLGNKLNLIGIDIIRITSIPDTKARIVDALNESIQRADVIILTGGLGPTQDDITKNTLAEYFNMTLKRNDAVFSRISEYIEARGLEMLQKHAQQADLPDGARVIDNLNGSASGMWFEKDNTIIISMPGVPYEMKAMMADVVIPELSRSQDSEIIHHTTLTQGIGESTLAGILEDWETRLRKSGLSLAYLPSPGAVKLRITSKDLTNGSSLVKQFAAELDQLIEKHIYGYGDETLPLVIGKMLRESGKTLSTAESCTGGFLAHQITSISGSSDYFMGSVVAYANEVKTGQLGVDIDILKQHGAVSEPVVKQMAEGVRKLLGTDYAIATSGIAGPLGGTEQKPVGTIWVAVAGPKETKALMFRFGNNRERNILMTSLSGLNMLRRLIKKALPH